LGHSHLKQQQNIYFNHLSIMTLTKYKITSKSILRKKRDKFHMPMNIWYIYSECCLTPKWENFQLYHGKNKLHFNEIMIMSVLYYRDTISCIFYSVSSLKQRADLDTVSRFRANSVKCDKLHMMMESRANMRSCDWGHVS